MCGVGDAILEHRYYDENAPWEAFANLSSDNPRINGAVSFANAMITFQNIVPISLYISIEFVKLAQAFLIWADDDIMYHNGRRTMARSWNLSDDLVSPRFSLIAGHLSPVQGQIQYIFSDKTGTLTQNVMAFRHCTVGGRVYKGDGKQPANVIAPDSRSSDSDPGSSETAATKAENGAPKVKLADDVAISFHDDAITRDLEDRNSQQARLLNGFFINLALCHTVLAAHDEEGIIQYKAQSPDESALVQAAADVGFVFMGRDKNMLKMVTPASNEPDEYELLQVIEFTSARKRMSVVVRRIEETGDRLYLLTKGADNVIFERLGKGQDHLKMKTEAQLDEFANEG